MVGLHCLCLSGWDCTHQTSARDWRTVKYLADGWGEAHVDIFLYLTHYLSCNMPDHFQLHLQQHQRNIYITHMTTMYRVLPFYFQYTASDLKRKWEWPWNEAFKSVVWQALTIQMCSFREETSRPYIHCDCYKFSRTGITCTHSHSKLATHIVLCSS